MGDWGQHRGEGRAPIPPAVDPGRASRYGSWRPVVRVGGRRDREQGSILGGTVGSKAKVPPNRYPLAGGNSRLEHFYVKRFKVVGNSPKERSLD